MNLTLPVVLRVHNLRLMKCEIKLIVWCTIISYVRMLYDTKSFIGQIATNAFFADLLQTLLHYAAFEGSDSDKILQQDLESFGILDWFQDSWLDSKDSCYSY